MSDPDDPLGAKFRPRLEAELASLRGEYEALREEYAKLQNEFNEWIDMLEDQ